MDSFQAIGYSIHKCSGMVHFKPKMVGNMLSSCKLKNKLHMNMSGKKLILFSGIILPIFFLSLLSFSPPTLALDCTNCKAGSCYCNVTECSSGALYVYSTLCSGIPSKQFVFTNSSFYWPNALQTNYYFQVYCDSGVKSDCTQVNLTSTANATTTTTTSSITTTSSTTSTTTKPACPENCCINDPYYLDKPCAAGYQCIYHTCVSTQTSTSTTSPPSGPSISYSTIAIIAIVIGAGILVLYFLFGRKKPDRWTALYKKWSKR